MQRLLNRHWGIHYIGPGGIANRSGKKARRRRCSARFLLPSSIVPIRAPSVSETSVTTESSHAANRRWEFSQPASRGLVKTSSLFLVERASARQVSLSDARLVPKIGSKRSAA